MGKPFAPSSSKTGHSHPGSVAPTTRPAADDISVADTEEMLVYHKSRGRAGGRHDDEDDNQSEAVDGDDKDSLTSAGVFDSNGMAVYDETEEDVVLPAHACQYVMRCIGSEVWGGTNCVAGIVASTPLALSSSA
jgi:hypothetical protein